MIAMFLSRYDREIAGAILNPIVARLQQQTEAAAGYTAELLRGPGRPEEGRCAIDRVPVTKDLSPDSNWLRIRVAETLALPPDARWRSIWRMHSGLGGLLFDRDVR